MDAKKYNNIKLTIGIIKGLLTFVLILLFVSFGYSSGLNDFLSGHIENSYLRLIVFSAILGFAGSVMFFPVKYYVEYYLEHKYKLSNQTVFSWLKEDFKGFLVGIAIGLPILMIFYFSLNYFEALWWLPFSIIMFIISVLLAKILPVIILPIFYKVVQVDDEELKRRILSLTDGVGMKVEDMFTFDMSKNTKKANAAFTGLGRTKKIILADTLVENYNYDEIETVIAHELGHYKHKHILKNIFISTIFSFLTFFLMAVLYDISLNWFGFESRTDIAALPLLSVWAMIIGLILTPVSNIISRKFEYQADEHAVRATAKPEDFIRTLSRLNEQNMGDEDPHPLVEWFFYSHPSVKRRISFIESLR